MSASPGYVVLSVPQSKYTAGSLVPLTASFYTVAGVLVDPTLVTFEWSLAGSSVVTGPITPTRVSAGIYTYDLDTTGFACGIVVWEAFGTGACQANGQGQFELDDLPF